MSIDGITRYGIIYGVKRTTVYFPDEMKAAIEREAKRRDVTEAEVIRTAMSALLHDAAPPPIDLPLFREPLGFDLAGRVDEFLEGLGENP